MIASPRPIWIPGFELQAGSVAGGPLYLLDWTLLGPNHTALRFVLINTGGTILTATPEAGYDGAHAEVGPLAPAAFQVQPGTAYGDPYGVDEMRPWWRFSVSGTGDFMWGVQGIER